MPGRSKPLSESTLETLEVFFTENAYPDIADRRLLAETTGITENRIANWFKGKRQVNAKKGIPIAGSGTKKRGHGRKAKFSTKKNYKKTTKEVESVTVNEHCNEQFDSPPDLPLESEQIGTRLQMMHEEYGTSEDYIPSASKLDMSPPCDAIGSQDLYLGMERREELELSVGDDNRYGQKSAGTLQNKGTSPNPHPCTSQFSSTVTTNTGAYTNCTNSSNHWNPAINSNPNWYQTSGANPCSQGLPVTSANSHCASNASPFSQCTMTANPNTQCASTSAYLQCPSGAMNDPAMCPGMYHPQPWGQVNQIAEYWQTGDHQRALTVIHQQRYDPGPGHQFVDNQPGYPMHQSHYTGPPYCPPYCFTVPQLSPYLGMPQCTMPSSWPRAIQPWWPVQPRNLFTGFGMNGANDTPAFNQPALTFQTCASNTFQPSYPGPHSCGQNHQPYGLTPQSCGSYNQPCGQNHQPCGKNYQPFRQNHQPFGHNHQPYGSTPQPCGSNQAYGTTSQPCGSNHQPCGLTLQQSNNSMQSQVPGAFTDNSNMQHSVYQISMNDGISSTSSFSCINNQAQAQSNTTSVNNVNTSNYPWNGQTTKQSNTTCSSTGENNLEQTKLPDFASSFGHQDQSYSHQGHYQHGQPSDNNYLNTLSDVALSQQHSSSAPHYLQL